MLVPDGTRLFYREVGAGRPLVLLHGGPDFDHTYLLPDMDRLSDAYRLIYYDQRGRGRSGENVRPEDVSIDSEIADLECLRQHLLLDRMAVVGHSWGGYLAMEYAIRHPDRLSHLILMNTAAASHDDYLVQRSEMQARKAPFEAEIRRLTDSREYREGDPDTVAAYYRIHFNAALHDSRHLDPLVATFRSSFTNENVLKGRAIGDRLCAETWHSSGCNLFPELERLALPTLVVHGDSDFIPAECAAHVARAIPGARYVLIENCSHFSYIEAPAAVRKAFAEFFATQPG